ncbi:hypothetical protein SARC_07195 [Sphaeroforma arctica JP610]|uniref:C3H1-type domain-containing protein n=1 Tax=Sphaeroforma arctica JP610 TaxID=667725 RepID=A0A0L0FUX5_9EUKA|nr:hypothetical protein SARC_07195 [Sphaeroforma arctica JP610]KNC80444.1 hypothetical protein SARC_07195 [Sphaeroforma arctica JP610]|eukprot:XP_014154346.1 hypothetical protein SARC_07195 [Sphaeroforma arctica JP610]
MASIGDDCRYYFFTKSCPKGKHCPQRHCEKAKSSEVICEPWRKGYCYKDQCPHLHHIPEYDGTFCYWETTDDGCDAPECRFRHRDRKKWRQAVKDKATQRSQMAPPPVHKTYSIRPGNGPEYMSVGRREEYTHPPMGGFARGGPGAIGRERDPYAPFDESYHDGYPVGPGQGGRLPPPAFARDREARERDGVGMGMRERGPLRDDDRERRDERRGLRAADRERERLDRGARGRRSERELSREGPPSERMRMRMSDRERGMPPTARFGAEDRRAMSPLPVRAAHRGQQRMSVHERLGPPVSRNGPEFQSGMMGGIPPGFPPHAPPQRMESYDDSLRSYEKRRDDYDDVEFRDEPGQMLRSGVSRVHINPNFGGPRPPPGGPGMHPRTHPSAYADDVYNMDRDDGDWEHSYYEHDRPPRGSIHRDRQAERGVVGRIRGPRAHAPHPTAPLSPPHARGMNGPRGRGPAPMRGRGGGFMGPQRPLPMGPMGGLARPSLLPLPPPEHRVGGHINGYVKPGRGARAKPGRGGKMGGKVNKAKPVQKGVKRKLGDAGATQKATNKRVAKANGQVDKQTTGGGHAEDTAHDQSQPADGHSTHTHAHEHMADDTRDAAETERREGDGEGLAMRSRTNTMGTTGSKRNDSDDMDDSDDDMGDDSNRGARSFRNSNRKRVKTTPSPTPDAYAAEVAGEEEIE